MSGAPARPGPDSHNTRAGLGVMDVPVAGREIGADLDRNPSGSDTLLN